VHQLNHLSGLTKPEAEAGWAWYTVCLGMEGLVMGFILSQDAENGQVAISHSPVLSTGNAAPAGPHFPSCTSLISWWCAAHPHLSSSLQWPEACVGAQCTALHLAAQPSLPRCCPPSSKQQGVACKQPSLRRSSSTQTIVAIICRIMHYVGQVRLSSSESFQSQILASLFLCTCVCLLQPEVFLPVKFLKFGLQASSHMHSPSVTG
jgi:hypothetical protein